MPLTNLSPIQFTKNYAMNADMGIAQRGTSFAAIINQAFSMDRWAYVKNGSMVHTVTQDTDVPSVAQVSAATGAGYLFQNSYRANLTTPQASLGAAESMRIEHRIEGYNWKSIAQKAFTVSFWVKATLAGTYGFSVRNNGADRSFVAEYTVGAGSWEYKTITIPASPVAGSWNYTNSIGLALNWSVGAGSSFQTSAGSWQTGNFFVTSNCVNGVQSGATDFRITGVMVNEGTVAAPFQLFSANSIQSEFATCQRYFWRTLPGASGIPALANGANSCYYFLRPPVQMRATPNLSGGTGTFALNNGGANTLSSSITPTGAASDADGGCIWAVNGWTGLSGAYQSTPAGSPTGYLTAEAEI